MFVNIIKMPRNINRSHTKKRFHNLESAWKARGITKINKNSNKLSNNFNSLSHSPHSANAPEAVPVSPEAVPVSPEAVPEAVPVSPEAAPVSPVSPEAVPVKNTNNIFHNSTPENRNESLDRLDKRKSIFGKTQAQKSLKEKKKKNSRLY